MRAALAKADMDLPDAPARWGDMRQHVFWGALYHWFVLTGFWDYRNFRPHRSLTVGQEFLLYLRRLALMPVHALERRLATLRIRRGGFPYHLVILQLEHDASFATIRPFLDDRIPGPGDRRLCQGRRHAPPSGVQGPPAGRRPRRAEARDPAPGCAPMASPTASISSAAASWPRC
jgi:hypothetical protein